MVFATITIVLLVIAILAVRLLKMNTKGIFIVILTLTVLCSGILCLKKPIMHKQFSIDIVDYFVKINDDGTMTTIKQTTKTILKKENKDSDR